MAKKQPSLRKVLRQARLWMPDRDPKSALWIYRRMNEAMNELQRIIAQDLAEAAKNAERL